MIEELRFAPGERITHSEFGAGVVLDGSHGGYLRAFFTNGDGSYSAMLIGYVEAA
jgi:hypothetical protein